MTDHNDTGATPRPSLTEMQIETLKECAGIRSPRLWGAAVGACLESLRGYGFIERNGKVTSAGATAIINAYEPLKARLAEVEGQRAELASKLSHLVDSLKHAEARALAAEARVAVLETTLGPIVAVVIDYIERGLDEDDHVIAGRMTRRGDDKDTPPRITFGDLRKIAALAAEQKESGK